MRAGDSVMSTVEDRLAALEAEVLELRGKDAVRHVLSRYAVGVDNKRPGILRELFDDDAVLSIPNWNIDVRGRDAVMRFFEDYWRRFDNPRRYYANDDIQVQGNHAEAFMYWQATQSRGDESILGWGSYEWGFKFVDQRWLITKEVVHILAMTTLTAGWAGEYTLSSL
jgi:ketosteroid isomerase-like protein